MSSPLRFFLFFFFNDTATTEIYTLSLHDALPIYRGSRPSRFRTRPSTRSPQATRTDRSARPLVAPVCFKADRSVEGRGAAESPPFFLVRHAGFRYDTTHHLGRWLHLEGLSHGPHHGLWEG